MDTAGFASLTYISRKKNITEEIKKQLVLKPSRNPQCGTFDFELRVWDRDDLKDLAEELKSSLRDIKKDLNEAAGISIYRDSFRVLPYGEPKNDWLRLDMRRVNNPTMRLSNNQIVGYVSVSLDNNKDLRDQSDREGIIESQAFLDFQEIIVSVISELEDKRYRERPRREETSTKDGIFAGITIAPVIEMVAKKLPDDKEAKEVVEETDRRIKEGVKKAQDVIARYRRLSTLGQLIDTVLHDGSGVLLKIETGALLLEKELKKETVDETVLKNNLELIKRERNVLAELFRRLEPFGGRKRGRPKEIILEKAINDIFAIHATEIETNKIKVTLPSGNTVVKIDEAEFDMILVNLLQNSLYWLETVSDRERQIFVSLSQDEDGLSLIFSDNGPGVSEDIAPFIFDPYYSKKPNGIGLGLTHVGEIVTEYDGTLELIDGGPLDGATFKITFRRRV